MNRFTGLLLVFAALAFAVVGCRRLSSDKKQPPVNVAAASDFVIPPSIDDKADAFLKKAKKAQPPADESKADKEARLAAEAKVEKEKEQKAKNRRLDMLQNIGKTYMTYLTTGTASRLTSEDIKQRLRRSRLDKERAAVENKDIEVVFEADPSYPEHVLAYVVTQEAGLNEAVLVNQTLEAINGQERIMRLTKQKLQAVYARYKAYSAQAQQQKSLEQFNAYLKENAQPALASAVATQTFKVNVAAQLGNNGQMVACFAKAVPNSGFGDDMPAIMGNGEIRAMTPAAVQAVFQGK